jgi:hypothetical protein
LHRSASPAWHEPEKAGFQGRHFSLTGPFSQTPSAIENIAHLALPNIDPVFGENGPLIEKWRMNLQRVIDEPSAGIA